MKQLFNARERNTDEWTDILKATDPLFRLNRITCSPGSALSIIEAIWEGPTS